jgi:hypothetical protein
MCDGARSFAIRNRVLLLLATNGVGLDIALGAFPFEENAVDRATWWQLDEEHALLTCSPEDLIVHKSFANCDQDWIDIKGVIIRQQDKLERDQIFNELTPLAELKEEPGIIERLWSLFEENT